VEEIEQMITVLLVRIGAVWQVGTELAPNTFQWWALCTRFQNDEDTLQEIAIKSWVENMEKLAGYCTNIPLYRNKRKPG
jgi:hypothetical protein